MAEPKEETISIQSSVYLHRLRNMGHNNLITTTFLALSIALGSCTHIGRTAFRCI